jgi:DNA topoisomerase-6 subunit B
MNGMLTTGRPVKIISKTSPRKPAHYYEVQIDTKKNSPEILNGRGDGVDIPPNDAGRRYIQKHGIEWETHYDAEDGHAPKEVKSGTRVTIELIGRCQRGRGSVDEYLEQTAIANPHVTLHYKDPEGNVKTYRRSTKELPAEPKEVKSGTRVTIELIGRCQRGRGSVEEYLEQTAIANPHVTLHYKDPEGNVRTYRRSTKQLPVEPKEIKPHPYGVELGRLVTMLKDTKAPTLSQFLCSSFSRVTGSVARRICEKAKVSTRASVKKIGRKEADAIYHAIQETKIKAPATDCISPIGEELLLKGLHHVVPGEFYCAATRPPSVYRGNPFQIEVGLAYGGGSSVQKVSFETLARLLGESDSRTLRQFLINTFDGLGPEAAERILKEAEFGSRQSPGKLKRADIEGLHAAMRDVNLSEGQTMQVLRYANRVPLQFQQGACAITQAVINTNWRAYGLSHPRGSVPHGPLTVMVHVASVWVPFTSESKEAIAAYPEIEKELRLGLQAVGRKLGMYLRRRKKVIQEGARRSVFLRYLKEVAGAVSAINGVNRDKLYGKLLKVAKRKTAEADVKLDDRGRPIEEMDGEYGDNVLIVQPDAVELTQPEQSGRRQGRLF